MIALVRIALRRPYTFVVLALVILIIGPLAALRTPVDIFPDIRIPVVAIVWQYTGLAAGADGRAHHLPVAARADDDGQRHRTHRGNVLQRPRHHQGVLPARRRHPARQRADHGDFADAAQADAAEHDAAAHSQLQRLDRSDHPARAFRLGPVRAGAGRHRPQHAAHAARHRSRRRHSPALWRQAAAGADRPRCAGDAGARPVRPGRRQRARRAESDHAGGTRKNRLVRIRHPAQQCAVGDRRPRRPADQERQRRDGLHPRRRARARRQPAADQYRARRRQPLGADADPEERLGLDARHHRRHQAEARRDQGYPAAKSEDRADRRSIDLHQGRGERRHPRRRHRRRADQR